MIKTQSFPEEPRIGDPVAYPEFLLADWYIHQMYEGATMVRTFSKFVPPDALKMHSLTLSVIRFLCKLFSKLFFFLVDDF